MFAVGLGKKDQARAREAKLAKENDSVFANAGLSNSISMYANAPADDVELEETPSNPEKPVEPEPPEGCPEPRLRLLRGAPKPTAQARPRKGNLPFYGVGCAGLHGQPRHPASASFGLVFSRRLPSNLHLPELLSVA